MVGLFATPRTPVIQESTHTDNGGCALMHQVIIAQRTHLYLTQDGDFSFFFFLFFCSIQMSGRVFRGTEWAVLYLRLSHALLDIPLDLPGLSNPGVPKHKKNKCVRYQKPQSSFTARAAGNPKWIKVSIEISPGHTCLLEHLHSSSGMAVGHRATWEQLSGRCDKLLC